MPLAGRSSTAPRASDPSATSGCFSPPGGSPRPLGLDLWAAQEILIETIAAHPLVYALKARQLGETTLCLAYDAWVTRFGAVNSRVHIFCQRESNAIEYLDEIHSGLRQLPDFMRLPIKPTVRSLQLNAGTGDRRTVRVYPSGSAVRGAAASHSHVDELAAIENGDKVWGSIEPSIIPGGTAHVLTTGVGALGFAADEWRRALVQESRLHPVFIPADKRPGRTPEWIAEQYRLLHPDVARREYPMCWEDALSGSGEAFFDPQSIDLTDVENVGYQPYRKGHRYVVSADFGRYNDATVFFVLDATELPCIDIVHGMRLLKMPMPQQARVLAELAEEYHAHVCGEVNMDFGVLESLDIPQSRIHGIRTSGFNKEGMLQRLRTRLDNQEIKWSHEQFPWLTEEMRAYRFPGDKALRQDAVMALSIGLAHLAEEKKARPEPGRILGVVQV